jgi:uncharacterized protein (DUF1015 family)
MEVGPFKAFRFNADIVGDVGGCIAPPYDVISPAQQQQLYEKNKYNIVRIIKGKTTASDNSDNNQYTRAADYLNNWIKEGVLEQDSTETIYAYVQDFQLAGTGFQRFSFIALARLEEFGETVRPHEETLDDPKIDRLNLKRATIAKWGLVFMLYEDREKVADKIIENDAGEKPLIDFHDDQNVQHRLFAITDQDNIKAITKMMLDKKCIIADGHHRYETALNYLRQSNNPAAKYQMLAFTNTCQEGLVVLATHRLVGNLENFNMDKLVADLRENFEITQFKFDPNPQARTDARQKMLAQPRTDARQKMLTQLKAEHDKDKNAFGIYAANNVFYVAVLRDKRTMDSVVPNMSLAWRTLDVSVLHKLILEKLLGIDEERIAKGGNLEYVKDTHNAIDNTISQLDAGQKQVAFFMNPVKIQQLKAVTDAGERMPQKSTYFYPKMYTGLTIQKL